MVMGNTINKLKIKKVGYYPLFYLMYLKSWPSLIFNKEW